MTASHSARTYNQDHVARKHTPGKRRVSIYWTWSYPWETNRDLTEMDNRFSSMTEVRRVAWPAFEATEWDKMNFLQGIGGTLELFHRSTLSFQKIVGEATGHPVAVFQRIDQAGYKLPIDERVLADTDTLMVFGLDHLVAEQEAEPGEIEAIREWLKREGTCLLLAPHHDVGFTGDAKQRQVEYRHHGDELVPRQQRFSQYTRSLMTGLDVPVMNQFGLRPAVVKGTNQITPLTANKDLDKLGLLNGVTTLECRGFAYLSLRIAIHPPAAAGKVCSISMGVFSSVSRAAAKAPRSVRVSMVRISSTKSISRSSATCWCRSLPACWWVSPQGSHSCGSGWSMRQCGACWHSRSASFPISAAWWPSAARR
jgi:hypothetical protein